MDATCKALGVAQPKPCLGAVLLQVECSESQESY